MNNHVVVIQLRYYKLT